MTRTNTLLLSVWVVLGTAGCAVRHLPFDTNVPAQILTPLEASAVRDGRARFREIFCQVLSSRPAPAGFSGDCETLLWRFSDEPDPATPPAALPSNDLRLRILMVAGAFSDCFPEIGMPYVKAAERLKTLGYRIDYVAISGRSSSPGNAARIAQAIESLELSRGDRLVLLGYSKGTTDILHFLVQIQAY